MSIKGYELLCYNFESFLENLGHIFCGRCFDQFGNDIRANSSYWRHHIGLAFKLCRSKKPVDLNKWFDDLEHGLFHGIMTCFMAQIASQAPNSELNLSKKVPQSSESRIHGVSDGEINLWISCLLHDLLKSQGFSQEEHDSALAQYFPSLDPQTYVHANPTDDSHPLVIGDRIELRRFSDFGSWKDENRLDYRKNFNPRTLDLIEVFYQVLRPALQVIMKYRNDIWIRHGLENVSAGYSRYYPTPNSYLTWSKDKAYAIEVDTLPFTQCANHGKKDDKQWWPFAEIRGFLSFQKFKQLGGKISDSTQPRDHLYALSQIHIDEWIFLFKDDIITKRHPRRNELLSLAKYSKGLIPDRIIVLFHQVIQLIIKNFTALNS